MKKRKVSNLSVKRISTSPYFSPEFAELEKAKIESVPGVVMLSSDNTQLAEILITNTHTDVEKMSSEIRSACSLMIHPNSGYDNIPAEFVRSVNFPIVIGNPIRAMAVSNYILSALFSHYSPIPDERQWSATRKWPRKLLSELNILILGQGHVGSLLKKGLEALVGSLKVVDPYLGLDDLNTNNIDVVIPACSLNVKNHHLIDREFLNSLNDDFLIINAARGDLVNTQDLIAVLKERPAAYAVLDVFEKEPADFLEFSKLKNIKVSSHIAGVFKNIDSVTADFEATVIGDFLNLDTKEFSKRYEKMILKNRLSKDGFLI